MRKIYLLSIFLLGTIFVKAQVSTTYSYSQINGTFTPITTGGGATAFGGGADDDQVFGPFNIGFPFLYNGTCYSQFCVDNNGFINFGPTQPLDSYNPISVGAANNVVSAFGNDLLMGFRTNLSTTNATNVCVVTSTAGLVIGGAIVNGNGFPNGTTITSMNGNTVTCSANATITSNSLFMTQNNGQKTYQTLGTTPNRTLVVQWLRARKVGQVNDCYNFQIRMEETTNAVSIVYGAFANNTNTMSLEVGLRGNSVFDFNNRSTLNNWSATSTGTANSDYCLISNSVTPASGLTYKWSFGTPVTGSTTVCGSNTNVITATGASTYSWSNGATTASIAVSPSVNTIYTVYASYAGSCVSSGTVSVVLAPNPTVTTAGPSTVCAGQSINISASGADTFSWSNGSNGATIAVSPSASTSYTATGTNTATGCWATAIQSITVLSIPNITIAGTQSVCAGLSLNFTASGADTYSWSNGSLSANITPAPAGNTVYAVTGTFTLTGCTNTAAVNVTVVPLPALSISGPTAICVGQTVNLTASGAQTYTWSNASNSTGISVSPTVNATYSVVGTGSNSCQNSSILNISVNALPSVSLTAASNSVCVNSGTVLLTGSPAGGTYSGPYVSGNTFDPLVTGTYTSLYLYTNTLTSCSNTANTIMMVSVCAGEKEISENDLFISVFPNPNNGQFKISSGDLSRKEFFLMDMSGKLILKTESELTETDFSLNNLDRGLYFLKVQSQGRVKVLKLAIE